MEASIEITFIAISIMLILSVAAGKISARSGIPSLLLFLIIGMLAGSEGIGGIYFDNAAIAQAVGLFALVIILFAGGLNAEWQEIRGVVRAGLSLATIGVLLTALVVGVVAHFLLRFTLLEGLLLGAIVSSTDAAAVFSLLPAQGIRLRGRLAPLLEFESGSNDPMAVFLTVGMIQLIQSPGLPPVNLLLMFIQQMAIGAAVGVAAGNLLLFLINRLRMGYSGLYPVLVLGMLLLTFGATSLIHGSGFLAVYLVGLVLSRIEFLHKRGLERFYDSLTGLLEIVMFLTLGLLVFPSHLVPVIIPGIIFAAVLIFVARPIGTWASLAFSKFSWREKTFISWVGLRGGVPIILATYPLLAGLPQSNLIFNVVFFVVLSSILIQGTTIAHVSRWLNVQEMEKGKPNYPLDLNPLQSWDGVLKEVVVKPDSWAAGRAIYQLGLPQNYLVVLVARDDTFLIPNGSLMLQANDRLLGLSDEETHQSVDQLLEQPKEIAEKRG